TCARPSLVIFISQIKDFLGVRIDALPGEFFAKMASMWAALPTLQLPTVALALVSLGVLVGWNRAAVKVRWMRRMPGPLAVLVIMTAINALFALPVDTIGSRFGGIPREIPAFGLPDLT